MPTEILPDQGSLVDRAVQIIVEKIESAIAQRGYCTLALAGGSTPKPVYEKLSQQNLPWEKLHIFWGDERYVPADHPDSNEKMAREAWLDQVAIPAENIHPMPTTGENPEADAEKHEQQLRSFFQCQAGEFPSLDIILLGMGDDGHTASLFPHTEALSVRDRLITIGNKGDSKRLSFTAPFLNQGRAVIFLVAGANKRPALKEIFSPQGDAMAYPARLIQPQGELWWLLDQEAGAEFST
ncbi:6-phosphogluconolactonase [Halothece sp. PCC 7418]|uniref:6-phosphogluconolactonase n=1 Tax=Halothece sp. (strain PCC 7418) TaxID=65093 RepID=UPI0002A06194|nr:6-phosphogluconolactonase [Halothece sp. PCC 7418]AFZ45178.1 6-phosphogluconolactonase [Halothece sp. PCC 7418]